MYEQGLLIQASKIILWLITQRYKAHSIIPYNMELPDSVTGVGDSSYNGRLFLFGKTARWYIAIAQRDTKSV